MFCYIFIESSSFKGDKCSPKMDYPALFITLTCIPFAFTKDNMTLHSSL